MKKILLSVGVFALLIFGLFGLLNRKEETVNKKIVISEVTHSLFYTPFYVSIHNDYFKDEGIDVEVILTSGADKVAAAVLSGDANVGLSGLEATLYVYDNGQEDYLVNFSSLTKRDGQFLVGDCKYKDNFSLDDIKGKRILVGRKGGMPEMVFNYALYKNGLKSSDVISDTSVEFASLSGAYIGSKEEVFVNLFEPTALSIEKEGFGCVLGSLGLLSGEVPYTVFHTKKSYLDNNRDTIKSFTNAIQKGLDFVKNNDSKTIAEVIKSEFPNNSLEDIEKVIDRYKDADSWWEDTSIKESAYNNLLDLMEYNNALDKKVNFEDIVINVNE